MVAQNRLEKQVPVPLAQKPRELHSGFSLSAILKKHRQECGAINKI